MGIYFEAYLFKFHIFKAHIHRIHSASATVGKCEICGNGYNRQARIDDCCFAIKRELRAKYVVNEGIPVNIDI